MEWSGKELAISALGAVSNAAEEAIVPFLGQIMEHLKVYLTAPDTEDGITLKTQAIDTLSVFARKIGQCVCLISIELHRTMI